MKNINKYKKLLAFEIIILFIGMTIASGVLHTVAYGEQIQSDSKTIEFSQKFSSPVLENDEEYVKIYVNEANSYTTNQGGPKLPVFTKAFEFPWGTEITDIECLYSDVKTMSISDKIEPVPLFKYLDSGQVKVEKKFNQITYKSHNSYPLDWFSYDEGSGINKNGDHVLFLALHIYPVKYIPAKNIIQYINSIQMTIKYKEPATTNFEPNEFDLVIIAPSEFSDNLLPLVNHKNSYGVKTNLTNLEYIYDSFPGRDEAEKIKYFIKYALEEWGISYVTLVGDIKKLPIRDTDAYPWKGFGDNILTDLYYADIYNETGDFCSWDANDNDTFGEVKYNHSGFPPQVIDLDGVDLYPDVRVGRLACRNIEEVDNVVNKIIIYEENTYGQRWFKRIVLAGGDTFPPNGLEGLFVFEGEITNKQVAKQLRNFRHIKLWASRRNLNALTFNIAINIGAGFITYAGHGFDVGWGTYRPNAFRKRMLFYNMMFLYGLRNRNKLPVVFFDACLTARLDFDMRMFSVRYPTLVKLFETITGITYDHSDLTPCFAWKFMTMKNGGAIATVGATRPAYTWVDKNGVYAGAGYLDVAFFKAYEKGITLGNMFIEAQNDYINKVGKDYFTIEVFILLGDPSLKVGGYP